MKPTLKIFLSLTILYALMIFYLSSLSNPKIPRELLILVNSFIHSSRHNDYFILFAPFYPLLKQQDKIFHVFLYFGFGILLSLTMKSIYKSIIKAVVLAFSLGVFYGASDEFHQLFVPGRSADIMDLMADAAGVLFAQVVIIIAYVIIALILYVYAKRDSEGS